MPRFRPHYDLRYRLTETKLPPCARQVGENLYRTQQDHVHYFWYALDGTPHFRTAGYYLANGDWVCLRSGGTGKADIKFHDFLHMTFRSLNCTIHSDWGHSIAGRRVWRLLSEYPDLKIRHFAYNKFAGLEVDFPFQERFELPLFRGDEFDKNWDLVKLPLESRFEVRVSLNIP